MTIFCGRKFCQENRKGQKTLETLLWIFTCSYNKTVAFLFIMPYFSQQIWKTIFYGRPHFHKGMKMTAFIKNKIICIRYFTLHFFMFSLLWFKHFVALCGVIIWLVKKCNWRYSARQRSKRNSKRPELVLFIAQLTNCSCSE